MKLSVIIPVYNTASTLERCVHSVIEQEGFSIEILLIDDGSTDSSPTLCDHLSRCYDSITVVHKQNGGLSDARNQGIERATGDYLTFVDSDDFLAKNTYQQAFETLSAHPEYDILEFPVLRFHGSSSESLLSFDDREYTDLRSYWLDCRAYEHSYAWNKIYRRQVFNDVRFPKNKFFEDMHTLPLLLRQCKIVATTSRGQYYYCANQHGITATADAQAHRDLLEAHICLLPHFDFHTTQEQNYYMHILNIQLTESELSGDAPQLRRVKIKLSCIDQRFKLKAALLRSFGVKGLCWIHRLYKKASQKMRF